MYTEAYLYYKQAWVDRFNQKFGMPAEPPSRKLVVETRKILKKYIYYVLYAYMHVMYLEV